MTAAQRRMELPRFRRDNSWIETLGRDVALAVALIAILVVMERMNDWITDSMAPIHVWREFFNAFRLLVVGQLAAVFIIFVGRYALPDAGVRRWLGLIVLVAFACVLGWQAMLQWKAFAWPHRPPVPPFVARMFQHQLAVTAALIAGLHEFLRISRRAAGALHDAQLRRIAIEGDLAEGRLQVLQAQIEPHFLFNSLANLRRLMRIDALAGQAMLTDLLRYLEVALPRMRDDHSTLGRDAELIRAFLAVHQVRMGDRLQTEIDIPSTLASRKVPPMMLLTLVENALKHGLGPLPEGGSVRVSATLASGRLLLSVADDGRGLVPGSGGGTGLANIRARLKAAYGSAAALSLRLNEPRGVVAAIELPGPTG